VVCCRPSFSNILQRLEQMLQQTPEELHVLPADELHSQQQQQQQQGTSTVGMGAPSPALLTTAGPAAQAAATAATAAGNDAAVTGDWTM